MTSNDKKCIPCEEATGKLSFDVVRKRISVLNNWQLHSNEKIEKVFVFKDFGEALVFANKVGDIAEKQNHHPDIFLHGWNKVTITLSTHSVGGLTDSDFKIAEKIDQL